MEKELYYQILINRENEKKKVIRLWKKERHKTLIESKKT